MAPQASKIHATIDFKTAGKSHGHLVAPYSRNESGWGSMRLPISVIKNGRGPTMLFTAGNHGDEYEGQIALRNLARLLDPAEVSGRVIIVPGLNYPAVMAGARLSPIDGGNMNRAFPGRRDGTITEMIAHYVHTNLLPLADAVIDMHSGGKTMMFLPFACIHEVPDAALKERARAAMFAFAAPISLELVELDAEGMLDTAVEDLGKVFVSMELGGGGTTTTHTLEIAETGVRNVLKHFGVLDGDPVSLEARGLPSMRAMHMPADECFVIAEDDGLYEALVDLDEMVETGQVIGQMHDPDRPERDPVAYRAGTSGTLIGRTHKVLMSAGDFVALIAHDDDRHGRSATGT